MQKVAHEVAVAPPLYRGANPREQPYSGFKRPYATTPRRIAQDVPTAEDSQRSRLSGADRPRHYRQPLPCRVQNNLSSDPHTGARTTH